MIGAGPAGLSAAYELVRLKPDLSVTVLEADPHYVGGISRTVSHHGYRFDIGGHRFFSKSAEVEAFWTAVLGPDLLRRDRLSRIYYEGKFFDYPLKAGNAFRNMGLRNTIGCLASYAKARMRPRSPVITFEDWVTNQFGDRLYRMFFKHYTEKVWGIPCDSISADWAAQRIRGLSLSTAVRNAFLPPRKATRGVIKTLTHSFRYPRLGPGMLWETLARDLVARGVAMEMGAAVTGLAIEDGRVATLETGTGHRAAFDHVISSMPLQSLVTNITPLPPATVLVAARALHYRDFLTVALVVDHPSLFPDNWIYIHDASVRVGRIQNFKNWSPDMVPDQSTTCLGLEYFCFEGDGLWSSDDGALIALGEQELRRIGLLPSGARVVDACVVRVPKAYPVYDDHYKSNVAAIMDWLRPNAPNLQVIGRNGMHRYNNQDHAVMTGFLAARNVLGAGYDVWSVNEDAQYLEEVRDGRSVPMPVSAARRPRRPSPAGEVPAVMPASPAGRERG